MLSQNKQFLKDFDKDLKVLIILKKNHFCYNFCLEVNQLTEYFFLISPIEKQIHFSFFKILKFAIVFKQLTLII